MGLACYLDRGVKKDLTEAADWYRRAGLNGHAKSQRNLGYMYEIGEGVNKDKALFKITIHCVLESNCLCANVQILD